MHEENITCQSHCDQEKRFIRFELAFDGEEQGVGLLNGISDVIGYDAGADFLDSFNALTIPVLPKVPGHSYQFWFSETGLRNFLDQLCKAIDMVGSVSGWSTIMQVATIDQDEAPIRYTDENQIALLTPFCGYQNQSNTELLSGSDLVNFLQEITAPTGAVDEEVFEDHMIRKSDAIDNAAYHLALALLRTDDERPDDDVLPWDIEIISEIAEAAEEILTQAGKSPCRPYYEDDIQCCASGSCHSTNCPMK